MENSEEKENSAIIKNSEKMENTKITENTEKEEESEDEDYLNLENMDRKVWLVKVPKYIADSWSKVSPGGTLGQLTINDEEAELRLGDSVISKPGQPISYNLRQSQKNEMMSFSTDSKDKPELEGQVVKRFDLCPTFDEACSSRAIASFEKANEFNSSELLGTIPKTLKKITPKLKPKPETTDIAAPVRTSEQQVQLAILRAFQKRETLNVLQINRFTKLPIKELTGTIHTVCDDAEMGAPRFTWKLKPSVRENLAEAIRNLEMQIEMQVPMDVNIWD